MPNKTLIRSIAFTPEGDVEFQYMNTDDLKANGLFVARSLVVPPVPDYVEDLEALRDAALAIIEDAMEDFDRLEPITPETLADEDDDDDDD